MSHWWVRFLVLTLILFSTIHGVLADAPTQGQELVTNGGFETGMQGWTAVNAHPVTTTQQGVYDASSHPPHSGQYSAQIGSVNQPGTLSQTVKIPSKSKARFTAWYRLEQGASITILLKTSDGSTIQKWSGSGSGWTPVTYDLNPSYAGQSIIIEFDGQGNSVVQSYIGICGYSRFGYAYYCPSQSESDYFAFIDDVSMVATRAQYASSVNIAGIPSVLSTRVFVDGTQMGTLSGGQSQDFPFNIGETHKLSVDDSIRVDNTTRYYCNSSSTTVTTDGQVTFSYQKQYYLAVNSPYGTTAGTGWYDEDSKVTFSAPGAVPMPGLLGIFGAKYVFDKWTGGEAPNNLQSSIVMDGPKAVAATWRADYTMLGVLIVIIALAIVGGFFGYKKLAEERVKRRRTAVYEDRGGVVIDVSQVEDEEHTRIKESESTQVAEAKETTQHKKDQDREKIEDAGNKKE